MRKDPEARFGNAGHVPEQSLDFVQLRARYECGALTPAALVEDLLARIAARGNDHVWIEQVDRDELLACARRLEAERPAGKPLYGIPFAIKDNINLAGHATTAACPAFAYHARESAIVVQRLVAAGAIPIGKTNLDQFATGLSGTRSPYGAPSCALRYGYISGGSSSGSAVAVAAGLVAFAFGTDTAGSGRRVQQSDRAQADSRPAQHAWGRAGLPLARLRFDLGANSGRRAFGIKRGRGVRRRGSVFTPRKDCSGNGAADGFWLPLRRSTR
jgi:Amidase